MPAPRRCARTLVDCIRLMKVEYLTQGPTAGDRGVRSEQIQSQGPIPGPKSLHIKADPAPWLSSVLGGVSRSLYASLPSGQKQRLWPLESPQPFVAISCKVANDGCDSSGKKEAGRSPKFRRKTVAWAAQDQQKLGAFATCPQPSLSARVPATVSPPQPC